MENFKRKVGIKGALRQVITKYTNMNVGGTSIASELEDTPGGRKCLIIKIYTPAP